MMALVERRCAYYRVVGPRKPCLMKFARQHIEDHFGIRTVEPEFHRPTKFSLLPEVISADSLAKYTYPWGSVSVVIPDLSLLRPWQARANWHNGPSFVLPALLTGVQNL